MPTVAADSHDASDDESDRAYQLVHGYDETQVISVDPIAGDEPVEEFYDARDPDGQSRSSLGTSEYQEDDKSMLMLYEGPDGVSLVAVHDKYHEDRAEGTRGGSLSWTVSGLPEDGEWAVIDDDPGRIEDDSHDDRFYIDPDHREGFSETDGEPPGRADALLSWEWSTGETDGVAYRGLNQDASITITPGFNEESYRRHDDQQDASSPADGNNGTVDDWVAIVPTDDGFERMDFHHTHEPTRIRSTSEPTRLGEMTLENDSIDPGEPARITAVIENPGDTDWTHEASLRIGDSELQSQTVTVPAGEERSVEFSQQISQTGVYEIGVDDEQRTLTVGDPESSDTDSEETTDEQAPGFGPAVALIALCVVVLGARHRTNN
ncbi:PGF-CTERM sorting domain-containing protein [Halohasta litorea]|uniref:PGF-CTERM sorting domain-containing protein n=1 Tax=Halohasta litorea TaxID=869891 RepID=A0ABD6D6T0_9EURY|nr:PGF-CTERM sorting domain-containing protein [Halohasta litorea]